MAMFIHAAIIAKYTKAGVLTKQVPCQSGLGSVPAITVNSDDKAEIASLQAKLRKRRQRAGYDMPRRYVKTLADADNFYDSQCQKCKNCSKEILWLTEKDLLSEDIERLRR